MKIKNRLIITVLVAFPLAVALFMVIEGVLYKMVTGHSLLGIDPACGAMMIAVSGFTIPFAIILRSHPLRK